MANYINLFKLHACNIDDDVLQLLQLYFFTNKEKSKSDIDNHLRHWVSGVSILVPRPRFTYDNNF